MSAYIVRRLFGLLPVLFGISVLVFLFVRLIPGDPARVMLGERATEEAVQRIREDLGLNQPLFVQYGKFISSLARGDLGSSIFSQIPVADELRRRWPATLELTIGAMVFATAIGILVGVLAAVRRNSAVDNFSMALALVGVSMPVFWLGMILVYAFSVYTPLLPPASRLANEFALFTPITGMHVLDALLRLDFPVLWDALKHLILPSVALGTIPMAIIARMTRSAMIEVLSQDYVRTAKAKGLNARVITLKHGLRNALLPVVTVVGLSFGALLGGAVLTETIFSWAGIGSWIYEGILQRDYPVVQNGVLVVAGVFVLVNLIVDLSYAALDPRIQYR